jgi:hypothetical protein
MVHKFGQKLAGNLHFQQPVAVLREHGVASHRNHIRMPASADEFVSGLLNAIVAAIGVCLQNASSSREDGVRDFRSLEA